MIKKKCINHMLSICKLGFHGALGNVGSKYHVISSALKADPPGTVARSAARDPHVRQCSFVEFLSMAILSLMLIQEEQLSVTGERMCTKYW